MGVDDRGTVYISDGGLRRIAGGVRTSTDERTSLIGAVVAAPSGPDVPVVVAEHLVGLTQPVMAFDRDTLAPVELPDQNHLLASCESITALSFLRGTPTVLDGKLAR